MLFKTRFEINIKMFINKYKRVEITNMTLQSKNGKLQMVDIYTGFNPKII